MLKLPIGIEFFRELREKDYCFVDKTGFIMELLDKGSKVTLINRPRRFGKTLALSMLKEFFAVQSAGKANIFAGLRVDLAGQEYTRHQGKYPVIFISMKDLEGSNYLEALQALRWKLAELYEGFPELELSVRLTDWEKRYFQRICNKDINVRLCSSTGEAADVEVQNIADVGEALSTPELAGALSLLCRLLYKHYRAKAVVLIDEYDAPIQHAWENGFYDEVMGFMRQMYSQVLKTNEYLELAVLTGVLRVAKESIFSGLNNQAVSTVLSHSYREAFGFTQAEVEALAGRLGLGHKLAELKEWYDGYRFGGMEIYNPWSVLMYLQEGGHPAAYWVNTSANGLIKQILQKLDRDNAVDLYALSAGKTVSKQLMEGLIYKQMSQAPDAFYTMLMTAGYLKCVGLQEDALGQELELQIPNKEIHQLFAREIMANLATTGSISSLRKMLRAMTCGNMEIFADNLTEILRSYVSFHDAAQGESFYHGLMLGFCVLLQDGYVVESNKESGYGRFDIAMFPRAKERNGIILEFKRAADVMELESKAAEALQQIADKAYISEFAKQDVGQVWQYGIAFCGKRICVKQGVE